MRVSSSFLVPMMILGACGTHAVCKFRKFPAALGHSPNISDPARAAKGGFRALLSGTGEFGLALRR